MKQVINRKDAGFTLLEVILSIAILAVVSVPLMKYFADSLEYSVHTGIKQNATLTAQKALEDIKSQEVLIDADGKLNYLTSSGYTEISNTIDMENKTGCADYMGVLGDYDVKVSVNVEKMPDGSDIAANTKIRDIVFGIDDAKSAMALERNQLEEALVYFMAKNAEYVIKSIPTPIPGAPPTPTPDPSLPTPTPDPTKPRILTQEEIRENLQRKIKITVGYESGAYTVNVKYTYYAFGIEDPTDTTTAEEYAPTAVLDTKVTTLSNIYLLFNAVTVDKDTIEIVRNPNIIGAPSTDPVPTLILLCQNMDDSTIFVDETDKYQLYVDRNGWGNEIRTNIVEGGGTVTCDGATTTIGELTSTGYPIRVISLVAEVYPKGSLGADGAPTKEAYVVVTTTKGE